MNTYTSSFAKLTPAVSLYLMLILLGGCIEPYNFVVENNEPGLVVEGFISNRSYQQTLDYPSDGRFFSIKLSTTSDVVNVRSESVTGARVQLINNSGERWQYTETQGENPVYLLLEPDFRAIPGVFYQLKIALQNEEIYESDWVKLSDEQAPPIGKVDFFEKDVERYVYVAGEEKIKIVKGMTVTLDLPAKQGDEPIFYQWFYDPLWIYVAPLPRASFGDNVTCWAKNENYLKSYDLAEDIRGGYPQELFFMETEGNERIYEGFSVLITQQVLNKDYFFFWKELQETSSGNSVFDQLPYNLASNIHSTNTDKSAFGYFGAVKEQAVRWYFQKDDLSYYVADDLETNCLKYGQPDPPPVECFDCIYYTRGQAVAEKPVWWEFVK